MSTVVVGAGPVGLALAVLLGQHGHPVTVIERRPAPYPLPRAVHLDDETQRVLAGCGIDLDGEPARDYAWFGADGEPVLRFDWTGPGPCGLPRSLMFHQPDLEAALARRVAGLPAVTVLRGQQVTGVHDGAVELADGRRLPATFVVGCDGANSVVADAIGSATVDLGFGYEWLILDVVPADPGPWSPVNQQYCDPRRPVSAVSGGPGRRRFEVMLLPGEPAADVDTDAFAWQTLARFGLHPGNSALDRRAIYRFGARWLETWQRETIFVAGDAAHQMPPFAGQGLCAGIRDAANLAWKLDRVLRGAAGPGLLDSYTTERLPHLRRAVEMSVTLGQIMCVTDPEAAAGRDAGLREAGSDGNALEAALPPAVLGPGLLVPDAGRPVGERMVQGPDDDLPNGFAVLTDGLLPVGPGTRRPATGAALDLLRENGLAAVVLRPDHYVYGAATDAGELEAVLGRLAADLG